MECLPPDTERLRPTPHKCMQRTTTTTTTTTTTSTATAIIFVGSAACPLPRSRPAPPARPPRTPRPAAALDFGGRRATRHQRRDAAETGARAPVAPRAPRHPRGKKHLFYLHFLFTMHTLTASVSLPCSFGRNRATSFGGKRASGGSGGARARAPRSPLALSTR